MLPNEMVLAPIQMLKIKYELSYQSTTRLKYIDTLDQLLIIHRTRKTSYVAFQTLRFEKSTVKWNFLWRHVRAKQVTLQVIFVLQSCNMFISYFSSIFSISFHYSTDFLPYFPNFITIQLSFLPYVPYLFFIVSNDSFKSNEKKIVKRYEKYGKYARKVFFFFYQNN
jgi:hypothetical protein